jgi:phosphoglycerate dehydrogenase-like enzyme
VAAWPEVRPTCHNTKNADMMQPIARRAAPLLLALAATLAPPAGVAADTPAGSLESLGLTPSGPPVRERSGWHPPKLILVDPYLHDVLAQLQSAAPGVKLVELPRATQREIAAADATLGVCSAPVLGAAPHLQWIQWLGAGVEACVHQPLVHEHQLLLTNMQRVAAPSMAEHVIALMLALSRHLDYFLQAQAQGHWSEDSPPLTDIGGHTVLVVGLGGIGTEVARRAHALGMRVTATRASGRGGPDFVSYVGLPDELQKLAGEADFVVNCTPLTPQTTGIFNQEFFAAMKPGAYFLNVGRGRSVVSADLVAALESHRIAGAGLDVTDPEPLPPQSPLWHAPNIIITPHVSSDTAVTAGERVALLQENLRRYAAGEPMLAVVDVARGY